VSPSRRFVANACSTIVRTRGFFSGKGRPEIRGSRLQAVRLRDCRVENVRNLQQRNRHGNDEVHDEEPSVPKSAQSAESMQFKP
jgi:hypothetical protein